MSVMGLCVGSMLTSGQVSLLRYCSSQKIRACGWWSSWLL